MTLAISDGEGLANLLNFPGSKGGNGVWQTIISEMPPHDLYVEPFCGSAQVFRRKRRAAATILIDSDAAVTAAVIAEYSEGAGTTVICDDGARWLESNLGRLNTRTVIYCDPPYLQSTRRDKTPRYYGEHDFTAEQHEDLLRVLSLLTVQRVPVLLTGYRSDLYDRRLRRWRRVDYPAMTRGGPVTESLWCNFERPWALHDYRYLGADFRERERVKRKKARWRQKLEKLPALERAAVLDAVNSLSAVIVGNDDTSCKQKLAEWRQRAGEGTP